MMDHIRKVERPKVGRLRSLCFRGLDLDLDPFSAPQVFSGNTGNTAQTCQNAP